MTVRATQSEQGRVRTGRIGAQAGVPAWVPSLFQSADLYISTTTPVGDGTFGRAWLRKTGRAVPMASILTRTGIGGTALDASGNVVSFTGTALRATNAGLTTEEARTNQNTNSAVPTVANGWVLENVTTTVQASGPGSGLLWYQYDDGTVATVTHRLITPAVQSYTLGTTYTYQAIVKFVNAQFVQLGYGTTAFGGTAYANFDIQNGVLGTVGAGTTATIKSLGANGYLLAISAAATATSSAQSTFTSVVPASNSARAPAYNGANNCFLVWNQDVTTGSSATAPILATSAAVTRAQDSIRFSDVSWLSQGTGTLYANTALYTGSPATATNVVFSVDDGSSSNTVWLYGNSPSGNPSMAGRIAAATVNAVTTASGSFMPNGAKGAAAFATNDQGLASNGVAITRGSAFTVPTFSAAHIGHDGTGGRVANEVLTELAYFSSSLSNAQLQAITT